MLLQLVSLFAVLGQAPDSEHLYYGAPNYEASGLGHTLIVRDGYALYHDNVNSIPQWVSYRLKKAWAFPANPVERPGDSAFKRDPVLEAMGLGATREDYKGSGWDRGHMAPSADMLRSEQIQAECFYLSNMVPQNGSLNSGQWNQLEGKCREYAKRFRDVTVITGPIHKPEGPVFPPIGLSQVKVPSHLFKVIVRKTGKSYKVLAFVTPNEKPPSGQKYPAWLTSVDEVEELTGLNLLNALPVKVQERIEKVKPTKVW